MNFDLENIPVLFPSSFSVFFIIGIVRFREIDNSKKKEGYSVKTAKLKGMNYILQGVAYNDMGKYAKAAHAGHNAIYHLDNASKNKQSEVSKVHFEPVL